MSDKTDYNDPVLISAVEDVFDFVDDWNNEVKAQHLRDSAYKTAKSLLTFALGGVVMSNESELAELAELDDNWDGYDGLAPSAEVLSNARAFLEMLPPDIEVTPNTNGTISFEWPGTHLEVGKTRFSMYNRTHYFDGQIKAR